MPVDPPRNWKSPAIASAAIALIIIASFLGVRRFFGLGQTDVPIEVAAPPGAAADEPIVPDPDAPRRSPVLWLPARKPDSAFRGPGVLMQELFRQALLLSARSELGLETRDGSLREWQTLPAHADWLDMKFGGDTLSLIEPNHGGDLWIRDYDSVMPDNARNYQAATVQAETLSRGEFVRILRRRGWIRVAGKPFSDGPEPTDAETRLGQMDELSQFTVLRETYAAIKRNGESLPRLSALVRAYANLGQLTRYHFSTEYAVYAARSLLYGQRMIARTPGSPLALRSLAYAQALAGLQGAALGNLSRAAALDPQPAPMWAALLEPYCRYHAAELIARASQDRSAAPLAMFLAFLSMQNTTSEDVRLAAAQNATSVNPDCLLLLDAASVDHRQSALIAAPIDAMPSAVARMLKRSIPAIGALPKPLSNQILAAGEDGSALAGRTSACRALIDRAASLQDSDEPSLGVLGRLIEEITFAQVQRMQMLIATDRQSGNGHDDDYAASVALAVADHPFRCMIPTYDALGHGDLDGARNALAAYLPAAEGMTIGQFQMWEVAKYVGLGGPTGSDNMWNCMFHNFDYTACDLDQYLACHHPLPDDRATLADVAALGNASPDSPVLLTFASAAPWTAEKIKRWEAHSRYPAIAMPLGIHYADIGHLADAERCFQNYVAIVPSASGYHWLASVYHSEGKTAEYLAMQEKAATVTKSDGNASSGDYCNIITHYLVRGDCKDALPYADLAEAAGTSAGLRSAGEVYVALGHWERAELLLQQAAQKGASPFEWYELCMRVGQGDREAADAAVQDYFTKPPEQLSDEDLMQLGTYRLITRSYDAAIQIYQRRLQRWPGPLSADTIAVLADQLDDAKTRDAAIETACAPAYAAGSMGQFAAVLRDAWTPDAAALCDARRIDPILRAADPPVRDTICLLAAMTLDHRGRHDAALAYLRRYPAAACYSAERAAIDAMLRERGYDPLTLRPAAQPSPTTRPN